MQADTTHGFVGGRVVTMEDGRPAPEVVVVQHGRIAAVGERALLRRFEGAEVHDLGGRALLPGFIDAHNHLCYTALQPLWADLRDAHDLDDIASALRDQAAREPDAEWVRGFGWDEGLTGPLTRSDLDALRLDRPIVVAHYSFHQCVVDSRGLDALSIGRATPDPPGGRIQRSDDGEPTGLLVERAWSEAHARSLRAYADPERWGELIARRARRLVQEGITCVHDAACPPRAERVYRKLAARRELPISVLVMPHAEAMLADPTDRGDGAVSGDGDELVRIGAMKFFADGGAVPAIDATRAGRRFTTGIALPGLVDGVVTAVRRGFRVAVHAMGNAGLATTLEAARSAQRVRPDDDHRFRIEHATLASREQISAMAGLGVIGVIQPAFVDLIGHRVRGYEFEDAAWMPFADLFSSGLALAASSDDPCAIFEPLLASALGTTRRIRDGEVFGADQRVPYEHWLRAYTIGAAYAGAQESERGSIAVGKRADLVVLDGDLDAERPPRVVQTWVEGELVHEAAEGDRI